MTQAITQFRGLLRSLVLDPMLLFAQVFSAQTVAQVVQQEVGETADRIYTPLATLAVFLSQILSNDHSCRNAVARFRSWRVAQGLKPCSLATGGYCTARKRLPETLVPIHSGVDGVVRNGSARTRTFTNGSASAAPSTAFFRPFLRRGILSGSGEGCSWWHSAFRLPGPHGPCT